MNRLDYYKALRNISTRSLYEFNKEIRRVPFCYEAVYKPLCDFIQAAWANHNKQTGKQTVVQVVVPRRYGKTMFITEGFPVWVLTQNPNERILISNEKLDNANDFLESIKADTSGEVKDCVYPQVYWNWKDGAKQWREDKILIARRTVGGHDPSIITTSVEVGRTSKHPRIVIIDDPHNLETISETTLDNVKDHYKSLTQVLAQDGFMIIITTRYDPNDIIGFLEDREGGGRASRTVYMKDGRKLAEIQQVGRWTRYFMRRIETDNKGSEYSTFEEAFSLEDAIRERNAHPALFAAQQQNNPLEGEHAPITEKQLDECWVQRDKVPSDSDIYMHCDLAFKDDDKIRRGDFNAAIEARHPVHPYTGNVYYTWAYYARSRGEEYIDAIVARFQYLRTRAKRVRAVTYDKPIGGGGDNFGTQLKNACHGAGMPCPILMPLSRQGKAKTKRIRHAAIFWANGRVYMVRNMQHADVLRRQMLMADMHDDLADCAADSFNDAIYKPQHNAKADKDNKWMPPSQLMPSKTGQLNWRTPFSVQSKDQWHSLDADNRFMYKGRAPGQGNW